MKRTYLAVGALVLVGLGLASARPRPAAEPATSAGDVTPSDPAPDGTVTETATVGATSPARAARTPARADDPGAHDQLVRAMRDTRACYASEACAFPKDDPRAYDFAVGRHLAAQLVEYRERFGADHPTERAELAREFMGVDDGFVREQAIGLLEGLPPNARDLAALGEGLRVNADPELVKQALPILATYVGTPDEPAAQELVRDMLRGPQFAGVETSDRLLPFIDESSFAAYRELSDDLPPGSRIGRNVRAALNEYERRRSGG